MKKVHVFDLDQTVINSDHRVLPLLDENNNLDLARYVSEACTHELIQKDQLLPLASYMQQLIQSGEKVVICTARHMSKSDYIFLRKNGLRTPLVLSRDQLVKHFNPDRARALYRSSDATYKGAYMDLVKAKFSGSNEFIIYDDHKGVLAVASEKGFTAIDAISLNRMLDSVLATALEELTDQLDAEHDSFVEAFSEALFAQA